MGKGASPSSDTTFLFHPFSVWLHFGPVALNLKVRSTKAWRDLNWTWLLIWSTSLWERWWRHPPGTRTSSMLKPTRFYIRMLWSCQAGRKIRWDRVSKMMFDIKLLHTAETDLVCWCPWYRSIGFPCFDISAQFLSGVTSPSKAPRSNNLEPQPWWQHLHLDSYYISIVDLPRSFLNTAKSQITWFLGVMSPQNLSSSLFWGVNPHVSPGLPCAWSSTWSPPCAYPAVACASACR